MIQIQPVNARWRFLLNRIESRIAENCIQRYDENADGIVEKSEFRGDGDVFNRTDRNQDSPLQLSEVKRYVDLPKQHEPARTLDGSRQPALPQSGLSFSVSTHDRLAGSIRDFFPGKIANLDQNGNGFLEKGELGETLEVFSRLDLDGDNLISSRERVEGFIQNDTEIRTVLKVYRFSEGTFQNSGDNLQVAV
ncbi:MAG: hypothetical protein GTN74_14520 [Proteobacteria bacterium]|nr:hypothetical protein [Pseudomonadota bacterium]NIS71753.1 hypothetical protein [Pseudomonadota bacterium]